MSRNALKNRPLPIEVQLKAQFDQAAKFHRQQQLDKAKLMYKRILQLAPQHVDAMHLLGVLYSQLKQHERAIALIRKSLELSPHQSHFHYNLGNALLIAQQPQAALESYDASIALQPNFATAHYNRGNAFKALLRPQEAAVCYAQAIALQPDYKEAYWNQSVAHLLAGEYSAGWRLFEWRWTCGVLEGAQGQFPSPLWLGKESLQGKIILLHSEQGIGDTFQFCRYLPRVKALGAQVMLAVEPHLLGIMASLADVDVLLNKEEQPMPYFDFHCPLLSLPLALGYFSEQALVTDVPYLFAPSDRVLTWRNRLKAPNKPRVGLVWQSGVRKDLPQEVHQANSRRNMGFNMIASLNRPEIDFYSLQKGEPAESELLAIKSQYWIGDNLHIYVTDIEDFSDTAAFIEQLDLVISVDTSVVHLAGAMGKPVWLLARYEACWRWLLDRNDSPWYPTMRIFRQRQLDDWESAIAEVKLALAQWYKEQNR